MTPHPTPIGQRTRLVRALPSRRRRLALAALLMPLSMTAAACEGGLTDSPATTPPPTTEIVVIEGRPLRRRNGRLHRARSRRGHSHLTDRQALWLASTVREALADHWRNQGELEHASVIAFDDLAHRLALVDAPDELLRRCLQAATQEADHADRCFELAGRYMGVSLRPGHLRRPHRRLRSRNRELAQLAVEALRDGVLNEGYAAWLAAAKATRATDARVQETLWVIARDEAGHARLSSDVLTWCLAEGDESVAAAVLEAASTLPVRMSGAVVPAGLDTRALADHGLLDADPDGEGYAEVLARTLADLAPLTETPERERAAA
ncbi:MAG: hypothetical protein Q7V88_04355 [Actinomycetota bacterium]|nr:hypothetical protein [Actinomycetota bacterium]